MEAYWQGEEMISRYYWAKRRDTDDIIWVRVDVRIVPQLDTGDLFAFYNNWDVTHEKNRDRMMQLIIEFDYDYVEYICLQNGHFEIMAQEKSSMCPSTRGTDYDADIRDYLTKVAVTDQLEAHIRAMQTEEIRRNLEAEPLYIQEIDVRESDGSVRRKMIRYTYMDKQMGTVFKSCVDIEDIVTEEKKKQERLERAIEETERANCAKSEFLAHMSHDIRTPMNAIIGMTSVARQECQDETICGYLDKIKSSSEFLLGLINDMLDTMYEAMGVGLAAPQVGILKRIVVIDIGDGPIILINPEILMTSGEQTGEEGCLSVPGMSGQVTRPNYVKVKALDMDMNEQIYEGEGLLARAFCHELDHLDGKMYTRLVEGELHHVSYDNEEEEE